MFTDLTLQLAWELEYHHNPPGINEHQQTKQTHIQAISPACLLIADPPIFHSSFEFFFYLFHKIIAFPIIYNEYKYKTAPPIRVNPTINAETTVSRLSMSIIGISY